MKIEKQLDYKLRVSQLIGEITQLATTINLFTEMRASVNFQGHVDEIEVRIYPNKKEYMEHAESGVTLQTYVNGWAAESDEDREIILKKLIQSKRTLKKILQDKRIDYGKLDYSIETVEIKHYYLDGESA